MQIDYKNIAIQCNSPSNYSNYLDYVEYNLIVTIQDIVWNNKALTLKVKPFNIDSKPITFIIHQKFDDRYDRSNITINSDKAFAMEMEYLLAQEDYSDYPIFKRLNKTQVTVIYTKVLETCTKLTLTTKDNIIKAQEILDALNKPNNQIFEFDYMTIDM